MVNILVIDDEKTVGNFLTYFFEEKLYHVTVGYSGTDYDRLIEERTYDLAMIDVKLPDRNGLDILEHIKQNQLSCKTIIMTGYSTVKIAVDAIKLGANDFIEKPFDDIDLLEQTVDQLLEGQMTVMEDDIRQLTAMSGIIVENSVVMKQLLTFAYKVATKNVNVFIQGETGTGKELIAHFIHLASHRNDQPYIRINCGALSETLLESELFGHEKGAFTGATKERKGVFEIANHGTLFLDEIGDASLATQVKLLRVIESGEYMRVGGETLKKTNIRIISATNVDLKEAVKEKKFREDLYYRLNVVELNIPPLRERKEDIVPIATYFLHKLNESFMLHVDTKTLLKTYDWPGNIRELSNMMKRAVSLLEPNEKIIDAKYFSHLTSSIPDEISTSKKKEEVNFEEKIQTFQQLVINMWKDEEILPLKPILEEIQQLEDYIGKQYIHKALKKYIGNKQKAAEALEITPRQLRYLLKEKDIR
ncbi:MAG TPA: sigma-54 dependent transcriptional regulator [Candidatus Pseudogracilibacillus intestinigallinarum]|uniref:Sigma-54 dependent transcriptional regulator n=1 Tax=Candidatus Pseudogracilibacillus intestinigallinarum TaxID=2838742 RepID=A0A9D1PM83_9BACI|nr:sigma-54 dependent transcriptional regulator [Candidatus Pseudogracilibacillus intestinigallinarum]